MRNMGSQKRKLRLDTYHMTRTVDRVTVSEESYTPLVDTLWLDLFKSPIQKQPVDIDSEIIMSDLRKNQLVDPSIDISLMNLHKNTDGISSNNKINIPQSLVRENIGVGSGKMFPKMKYNSLNFRIKQSLLDKSKDIHQPAWTPELGAWKSMDDDILETEEKKDEYSMHPPMLSTYLQDPKRLADNHEENIAELYGSIKKGYTLKNISDKDSEIITDALRIAYVGLWGKTTLRSMDVSINRARGIAAVLGEIGADFDVMVAGILNELIYEVQFDDNFASLIRPALVKKFGEDTVILTENYLRLPKFMAKRKTFSESQSEEQMQMLVALAEDYRTLYIRIADRVSTLRVLRRLPGLSEEDRIKIATESLHLYAPLAHKMGVMKVKGELEDLAFKYVDPEAFRDCKYTQTAANKAYHDSAAMIADIISSDEYLKKQNLNFRVTYRVKDKYQLYLKMKRKKISLSEVRDALGLRVIIDTKRIPGESQKEYIERGNKNCYHLLSQIRAAEEWTPCGYKDYIAGAKENGYQSLHQYISNKATGTAVEIQIRTREMHISAEVGEAAHWFYKDQLYRSDIANSKSYKKAWRSPEQLEASSPAELIGLAKRQLSKERVFITLGDKATVLNLAKGSTALDAAFAIHGGLGLRTSDIIVNGKSAPLSSVLANGDIITVVRNEVSKIPNPPVSYLTMVKTDAAKRSLRTHFKLQKKAVLLCMGMIQLASTISLNSEAILERNFENLPAAAQLNRFAQLRWKSKDGKPGDISDVLMALGAAPKHEVASMMGSLLDLPKEGISVVNRDTALRWIRMQSQHGFADRSTLTLLMDLMDLCGKGERSRLESRWSLLTGSNLVDTPSPYFSILQKKLTSGKEKSSQ
jgi:(p)ppGpp synthase/HD superfamily hydrolase